MSLERLIAPQTGASSPLICMEVNPPRGVEIEPLFKRLEPFKSKIDFFNVTDSALARMKCASLPFASLLKQRFGIEPLVNVACRDRNLIALQGDLLSAWILGIRSVVALTGDAVTTGDYPGGKSVFEVNSVGLLETIRTLNNGLDIVGNFLKGSPSFVSGVVVNPNSKNPKVEIKRLAKKVAAGAQYALSQPVFEAEKAVSFFSEACSVDVPILVGLLPFKTIKAGRAIVQIPGIRLSPDLTKAVDAGKEEDLGRMSTDCCLEVASLCRKLVRGFHVISGASPYMGLELVEKLKNRLG
jgi:5,10-methylenetetrahydrofolate reductase